MVPPVTYPMRIDTAGRGCPPWARLGEQAQILRPLEAWLPDQTHHLSSERHGIMIGNGHQAYQGHAPEDKHDTSMLMIARLRRSLLMLSIFSALLAFVAGLFRSRASLCLENLALPFDRSGVLGVPVPSLAGLARRPSIRPAPHRDCLAAATISRPLAARESAGKAQLPCDCQGSP